MQAPALGRGSHVTGFYDSPGVERDWIDSKTAAKENHTSGIPPLGYFDRAIPKYQRPPVLA